MSDKRFCFIPAKSNSQRLPGKNLRRLNGKELIYYPITSARDSNLFAPEDIVVSSESDEIRELANKYGANSRYRRPEKFSRDPYGVKDVLIDYLQQHDQHADYETVCILLPTAPLMESQDIVSAYSLFQTGQYRTVISVSETDHNSLRSVYLNQGMIEPIHPECLSQKSQELPSTYRINGAVIIISVPDLLQHRSYFVEPLGGYAMPQQRSIDIDTEMDFKLAEFLIYQRDQLN